MTARPGSIVSVPLRTAVFVVAVCAVFATLVSALPPAHADSSSRELASYDGRHMAPDGDVACGWSGRGDARNAHRPAAP
jgi:hypothetical protein